MNFYVVTDEDVEALIRIGKRTRYEWREPIEEWIGQFIDDIKRREEKELTPQQEKELYYLLLGIFKKFGEYDERYHLAYIGTLLNQ